MKSIIESMLFVWGEPLSISKLSAILHASRKEIKEVIQEMADEYETNDRGVRIIEVDKHYQLTSAPENHIWLQELCTKSKSKGLSHSSLEVLAIIAYRQPITRSEIEQIRGVKCEKPINHLLERDLVEEKGRLDRIGKPIIYGTTKMFLTGFGFSSLKELPSIEDFHNVEFLLRNLEEEEEPVEKNNTNSNEEVVKIENEASKDD